MAARTLRLGERNDAMFSPTEKVKIDRAEVESLIVECVQMAGDDAALRRAYRRLWELPAGDAQRPAQPVDMANLN